MNRFKSIKSASILGVLANIFLLFLKATIGFYTKSQAMIADSINSAGDVLSSLFTFVGNHISNKPSDEDHNFGHREIRIYIFFAYKYSYGNGIFKNVI